MSDDPMVAKLAARYLAEFDTVADHDDSLRFARNLARVAHEMHADEIERLRAELLTLQNIRNQDLATFHAQRSEIERLRAWIDSLEPIRGYEAVRCPICRQATEYRFYQEPEPHDDGCPWRESQRRIAAP